MNPAPDDYYKLLGLRPGAPTADIVKAFRKKSRVFHPDKNPGCEELMKSLNQAKATLLDPNARARYDADYESSAGDSDGHKISLHVGKRYSDAIRKQYASFVSDFQRGIRIVDNTELLVENLNQLDDDLLDLICVYPDTKDTGVDIFPIEKSSTPAEYELLKQLVYEQNTMLLAQFLRDAGCRDAALKLHAELTAGRDLDQLPVKFKATLLLLEGAAIMMTDEKQGGLQCFRRAMATYPADEIMAAIVNLLGVNYVHCAIGDLVKFLTTEEIAVPSIHSYIQGLQMNPGLKATKQYEKAVLASADHPFEKALLYADLSMAATQIVVVVNNFIMAAKFMEESMRASTVDDHIYACHCIIIGLLTNVVFLTRKYLDPSAAIYALKHCWVFLRNSTTRLRSVRCNSIRKGTEVKLVTPLQEELMKIMRVDLVKFVRVCPLMEYPLALSGDLIFLELIGTEFLECFYKHQVLNNPFHPFNHLYHYYLLEISVKRSREDDEFLARRSSSMEALLMSKQWNWLEVESLMNWPLIQRDGDGWWNMSATDLNVPGDNYDTVEGIRINTDTGEFQLLLGKYEDDKAGLFNMDDVMDIFTNGITSSVFTLDQADAELHFHPFQQMKYAPESLKNTNILGTMLHGDYLLKMLTMGSEVSATYPFLLRDANDGLVNSLPEHLKEGLSVLSKKGDQRSTGQVHRFWIEAGECPFDAEQDGDTITYILDDIPMQVRKHLMKYGSDGLLEDDEDSEDDTANDDSDDDEKRNCIRREKKCSPEKDFADFFTDHYEEIGFHFPVLLRLRELLKIAALGVFLRSVRENVKDHANADAIIRGPINEMLDRVRAQVSYPSGEVEVTTHYRQLLQKNGYRANQISDSQEMEVKEDIRRQLREADKSNLDTITKQLAEAYTIELNYSLTENVKTWLSGSSRTALSTRLFTGVKQRLEAKLNRLDSNLQSIGFRLDADKITDLCKLKSCTWVPSAYRKRSFGMVYGGVNLTLRLVPRSSSGEQTSAGSGGGNGGGGNGGGGNGGGGNGGGGSGGGGNGGGGNGRGGNGRGGNDGGGNGGSGNGGGGGHSGKDVDDDDYPKRGRGSRKNNNHKNRKDYQGEVWVYTITSKQKGDTNTGEERGAYKVGISATGFLKSTGPKGERLLKRAQAQVNQLNKKTGVIHTAVVRQVFKTRREAEKYERDFRDRFRKYHKDETKPDQTLLPGNRERY